MRVLEQSDEQCSVARSWSTSKGHELQGGGAKIMSCLRKCLLLSNLYLEWGAMLDILKKPKKANKKMARNKGGSSRISQV